jgi:hypothetical protein
LAAMLRAVNAVPSGVNTNGKISEMALDCKEAVLRGTGEVLQLWVAGRDSKR